jgi:general L-amino acid transport system permease protein
MVGRVIGTFRRAPMFRDSANVVATAICGGIAVWASWMFARWAFVHAVWVLPDGAGPAACRAASGRGACWAVVHERFRFMLFGGYPFAEHWRPAAACGLFVTLYAVTMVRACWKAWLPGLWVAAGAAALAVLRGGVLGLSSVPTDSWGGLPLTFALSTIGFAAAFPLAVALALGRRSGLPVVRALSAAWIEIVRGIPLVTFLFMGAVMLPLFVRPGFMTDKLVRAQLAFVVVIAAYVAEVVGAGLDAVPTGQREAAASLGLNFWHATFLVVLPQALRVAIPALVNTFVAFFKDTSLVAVIGMFDFLGAARAVLVDAKWVGFGVEVYLFASIVYFGFCFAVSRYSQYLERIFPTTGYR